ncbi:MAG: aldehyde dehydrogenase [Bacteroidetes bacterium]|nr:aldehyde dehydrogenase [Bacteroidota bacterium]
MTKKPIDELITAQKDFFNSHVTLDINFRKEQLKKLKLAIKKYEKEIIRALGMDLGKGEFEAFSTEVGMVQTELTKHIKNLKKWANPKKVLTPIFAFPSTSRIYSQPFGKVLIICPFNYPFMLAMAPLVGAISAGNVVTIKPSEYTPNTAAIIEKIIVEIFDEDYVAVVQGGVEVSQELLTHRWDKLFFTGSSKVGKIVLESAAKYLTPVILELGGKNPVVVDKDANLKVAAKRIIWGKLLNAGQSCVAPDYLYVHNDVKDKILPLLKEAIEEFYSAHQNTSVDFTDIVNEAAIKRLTGLLEGTTVYYGGNIDEKKKYFSPTILVDVTVDSAVMQDEIFGPILPVLGFDEIEEVIEYINGGEKPLSLYYFSENVKKQKDFLRKTYSGDAAINEVVMHFTNLSLPFGGVGYSGMGSYHGKRSFEVFSHKRSVMKTTTFIDLPLRYPPYKKWVLKLMRVLFR